MNELVEQNENVVAVPVAATPQALLATAVANGASLEQMEKLMELQERWEANEAKKAYFKAISDFRSKCPAISKTEDGHNCKYASLAGTIEQIKPVLSACGLSHSWRTNQTDSGVVQVKCVISHELGHQEETQLGAAPDTTGSKNAIQSIGSVVSYLERYTLFAALGLASKEMDNDGGEPEINTITPEQVKQIRDAIAVAGVDEAYVCEKAGVERIEEIEQRRLQAAISHLQRLAQSAQGEEADAG